MIALWQALLLALASAGFTFVVTWMTQARQQTHELAMQQQRLQAERQNRQDEAIRATRRATLQPVFDVLAELEAGYAHRRWGELIKLAEKAGVLDLSSSDLFPDGVPEAVSVKLMKKIQDVIPAPSPGLAARVSVVRYRIDDESIRRDLLALALGLSKPDRDDVDMLRKIAELHTRLEHYAASIDSST